MNICVVSILFGLCAVVPVISEGTEYQVSTEGEPENELEVRDRLEKLQQEYEEEQRRRDSDWLNRYKAVFIEGTESRDPEGMVELFEDLYKSNPGDSLSPIVIHLGGDVFNLVRISPKFDKNCDNSGFERFDKLLQKYAKGFSNSIIDYVHFQRSRFWKKCKQAFLDCQRPDAGSYKDDENETFLLATFTSCALNTNANAKEQISSLDLNLKSVQTAVVYYIDYKLEKDAHKKDKIKALFDTTIVPVCRSVQSRFVDNDKVGEIVKNREELKTDLDERSNSWLTAIEVCEVILGQRDLIERSAHSPNKFWHNEVKWDYLNYFAGCFRV